MLKSVSNGKIAKSVDGIDSRDKSIDGGNNSVDGGNNSVDGGNNSVDCGNNSVDGGNNSVDSGNRVDRRVHRISRVHRCRIARDHTRVGSVPRISLGLSLSFALYN